MYNKNKGYVFFSMVFFIGLLSLIVLFTYSYFKFTNDAEYSITLSKIEKHVSSYPEQVYPTNLKKLRSIDDEEAIQYKKTGFGLNLQIDEKNNSLTINILAKPNKCEYLLKSYFNEDKNKNSVSSFILNSVTYDEQTTFNKEVVKKLCDNEKNDFEFKYKLVKK